MKAALTDRLRKAAAAFDGWDGNREHAALLRAAANEIAVAHRALDQAGIPILERGHFASLLTRINTLCQRFAAAKKPPEPQP